METRILGRTNLEVGVVGLGVEHMAADRETMDAVFDVAVSASVNYVDLVYHDPLDEHPEHWEAITPALRRHRDSLVLAAHWGFVTHEPVAECKRCFDEVLHRLGNDYAEIAMLTMVDTESDWRGWAIDAIDHLRSYQRDGRVGFIGLSNHDVEVARMAAQSGLIDVLMFPVNLYQHAGSQERVALLETCAKWQVGVVAMKPYHGGRLLSIEGSPSGITPAQCLHYVLSQPIAAAVPGARNAYEMRQALSYVDASAAEREFAALQDELVERLRGQCVSCEHCLPCPQEISIPEVIHFVEMVEYYGHGPSHEQSSRDAYANLHANASDCTECEICLGRCPFDVDVIGKMRRAVEVFAAD
jgi:predicted aldo/keto reductase-like oxidoreductase